MDKDREELINSIRDRLPDDEQLDIVEKMAEKMKGKTDEEIFAEIKKLNKEMESQLPLEKYNEVLGKLEKVRPMLSKSQSQKLDMLLESLKEDNKKQE
ncbi:MAG: hypothetical protein GX231_05175 [Tissierellia bacterium]|nr:hypothetical protein [Tissierellia bacterium]